MENGDNCTGLSVSIKGNKNTLSDVGMALTIKARSLGLVLNNSE
jgi:hypothetical protein